MTAAPPVLTAENALFLDFDGTLVEIGPTPESVVVPEGLVVLLDRLRGTLAGALAIVSGRDLDDLTGHLSPLVLPAAGTHGMERRLPDGTLHVPGPDVAAEAKEMADRVSDMVMGLHGVRVERKPYSVGLHFRAAPEQEDRCVDVLTHVIAGRRHTWELMAGKMVAEVRLAGHSKASAVRAFMSEPPFAGRVPVFVGDDVTDEAGIRAASDLGGFGIKVGMGDSIAHYRLDGPEAVQRYLSRVANLV